MLFDNAGELTGTIAKGEPGSVRCIEAFSKGFITGGDVLETTGSAVAGTLRVKQDPLCPGVLCIYEKTDEKSFHRSKMVKLDGGGFRSLSISPSEETLIATTQTGQVVKLSLMSSDLIKEEQAGSLFEPLVAPFHNGEIRGMDTCLRKSLLITVGADRKVMVWNYADRTLELSKQFAEEAFSVAMHPSGFHVIVGFFDKLRVMNLLMEDLKTFKEVPVKSCRDVRFSHGGQLFAAANAN